MRIFLASLSLLTLSAQASVPELARRAIEHVRDTPSATREFVAGNFQPSNVAFVSGGDTASEGASPFQIPLAELFTSLRGKDATLLKLALFSMPARYVDDLLPALGIVDQEGRIHTSHNVIATERLCRLLAKVSSCRAQASDPECQVDVSLVPDNDQAAVRALGEMLHKTLLGSADGLVADSAPTMTRDLFFAAKSSLAERMADLAAGCPRAHLKALELKDCGGKYLADLLFKDKRALQGSLKRVPTEEIFAAGGASHREMEYRLSGGDEARLQFVVAQGKLRDSESMSALALAQLRAKRDALVKKIGQQPYRIYGLALALHPEVGAPESITAHEFSEWRAEAGNFATKITWATLAKAEALKHYEFTFSEAELSAIESFCKEALERGVGGLPGQRCRQSVPHIASFRADTRALALLNEQLQGGKAVNLPEDILESSYVQLERPATRLECSQEQSLVASKKTNGVLGGSLNTGFMGGYTVTPFINSFTSFDVGANGERFHNIGFGFDNDTEHRLRAARAQERKEREATRKLEEQRAKALRDLDKNNIEFAKRLREFLRDLNKDLSSLQRKSEKEINKLHEELRKLEGKRSELERKRAEAERKGRHDDMIKREQDIGELQAKRDTLSRKAELWASLDALQELGETSGPESIEALVYRLAVLKDGKSPLQSQGEWLESSYAKKWRELKEFKRQKVDVVR